MARLKRVKSLLWSRPSGLHLRLQPPPPPEVPPSRTSGRKDFECVTAAGDPRICTATKKPPKLVSYLKNKSFSGGISFWLCREKHKNHAREPNNVANTDGSGLSQIRVASVELGACGKVMALQKAFHRTLGKPGISGPRGRFDEVINSAVMNKFGQAMVLAEQDVDYRR